MTERVTTLENVKDATTEAMSVLDGIVAELSQAQHDLKLILRRALHVCNLLNWTKDVPWITCELYGYPADRVLPWYRETVLAERYWRPEGLLNLTQYVTDKVIDGGRDSSTEAYPVRWGIDDLQRYATGGVYLPTGEERVRFSSQRGKEVAAREVLGINAQTIGKVLNNLENDLFRWASNAYITVKFGDMVSDIWISYRAAVDGKLAEIGLVDVLRQISAGLVSGQLEAWRQSMLSCRNLLHDVAKFLWRDPRPTYGHLPDDDGNPIKVTEDRYVNRIMAYLHQKGVVGATGDYLRAQWRCLRRLNDLASSAKDADAVTLEDARATAIAVYVALGELFGRTDGVPIDHYN